MNKKTIKTLVLYVIAIAIIAVFTLKFVDWVTQPISEDESNEFCGENVTWEVDKKKMYIRGTGAMQDYINESVPWSAANKTSITTIIIEDGVTHIGAYAFEGFKALETIQIASSVTSIGDYAFHWCKSITELSLPSTVTEIGSYAFAECRELTSLTLSDGMTTIGSNAFLLCENLTSVNFGKGISEIGEHAFENCYSLAEISLPANVKKIGAFAFNSCHSLANINLENVTEIAEGAFQFTAIDKTVALEGSQATVADNAFFTSSAVAPVVEVE